PETRSFSTKPASSLEVSDLTATPSMENGGAVTVRWTAIPHATHYRLTRLAVQPNGHNLIATVTRQQFLAAGRQFVDTDLGFKHDYDYTVRACEDDVCGPVSASVRAQLRDATLPTITIAAPQDGALFDPGEVPAADFSCDGTGSPITSCEATNDGD